MSPPPGICHQRQKMVTLGVSWEEGGGGGWLQLTDAIIPNNTLWEIHCRVGELLFVINIVYVPPNKILILGSSFITGCQKLFASIPRIRFNFFKV